jgi:hypothetical protein
MAIISQNSLNVLGYLNPQKIFVSFPWYSDDPWAIKTEFITNGTSITCKIEGDLKNIEKIFGIWIDESKRNMAGR